MKKKRSRKERLEQAHREAENSPIVRQLRELYERGMAELREREASRYLVLIEGSGDSYSGLAPDLPGCVATGSSREEVERLMAEAIRQHIESLRSHGEAVPAPQTQARYVAI